MTAYKVNFKKFVSNILERDLRDLSTLDEGLGIHFQRFTNDHSISCFLANTEKHFRM
jgi:hypothetical protein